MTRSGGWNRHHGRMLDFGKHFILGHTIGIGFEIESFQWSPKPRVRAANRAAYALGDHGPTHRSRHSPTRSESPVHVGPPDS
jgi:hypothetical protein